MKNKSKLPAGELAYRITIGVGLTIIVVLSAYLLLTPDEPNAESMGIRTLTDPIPEADVVAYAQLADDETLALGETVYVAECASCHGADGEGQFPDAPLERDDTGRYGAPPHDGTGHTWHHDDDLLIRIIREGGMGDPANFYPMPALGEVLTDDEITAVLGYIKTMWSPEQQSMQREQTMAARAQQG